MSPEEIKAVRAECRLRIKSAPGYRGVLNSVVAALDHLTEANEELRAEVEATRRELIELTTSIWRAEYRKDSPNWQPLDTLPGLVSQIDNMYAGVRGQRDVAQWDLNEARATIDRLQTTIKAFNNGMPAMTTKEVADENADLRATIDRLTKERDEARAQFDNHVVWASGQAAELEAKVARLTKGRDSFAASYTHAAEERDQARTRLSAMQEAIDEAVSRADLGTVVGRVITEPLRNLTKPEPEVDPLAPALKEADSKTTSHDREYIDMARELRTALAARGGRVVFDQRPICSADGCNRREPCGAFCRDNGNFRNHTEGHTDD